MPFPDPCGTSRNNVHPLKMKKRRQVNIVPTTDSSSAVTSSAPISLPKSHISRTQSEIQLEALTLRAADEDVRMYWRLLSGMQNQIRHRSDASGDDDVHPLSRKSLQGIVNTKRANYQDLTPQEDGIGVDNDNAVGWDVSYIPINEDGIGVDNADDVGWDVSYIPIAEDDDNCYVGSSMEGLASSQGLKESELIDNMDEMDQEDDGVFSMEL